MNIDVLKYDESKTKLKNRKTILETAFKLFLDKSIEGTTIIDISNNSNISRQTIYNYYTNKELIAEDLHIVMLEKIEWFNLFDRNLHINTKEKFKDIAHILLNDYLAEFAYINLFDITFYKTYTSNKFPLFLNSKLNISPYIKIQPYTTMCSIQIFLGYCQRIAQRIGFNKTCPQEYFSEIEELIDLLAL